jgi:hypothetical protein
MFAIRRRRADRPTIRRPRRMTRGRPFTPGELARLRPVFGATVDYGDIALCRGAGRNPIAAIAFAHGSAAIALGKTIHVRRDCWSDDYSTCGDMGLVFHETTHMYQYANALPGGVLGPPLIGLQSLLMGGGAFAYEIGDVTADTDFNRLGYEQQAVVVEAFATAVRDEDLERASMCARVLRTAKPVLLPNGMAALGRRGRFGAGLEAEDDPGGQSDREADGMADLDGSDRLQVQGDLEGCEDEQRDGRP